MSYRQKGINWTGLFMTQLLVSTDVYAVYTCLRKLSRGLRIYICLYIKQYIFYIYITKVSIFIRRQRRHLYKYMKLLINFVYGNVYGTKMSTHFIRRQINF